MEKRECEICGKHFYVDKSRMKHGRGKHCSPVCQYEARRRAPKKVKIWTCIGCGINFEVPLSKLSHKGVGKYCSRECRDKYWVGKNNPNWQNGDKVYKRGPRWFSIKRRIIKRDGCCQNCGETERLHVHHKVPFRMFDDPDVANEETNLIALCPPCHRKEDAKYKWIKIDENVLRFDAGDPEWEVIKIKELINERVS